MTAASRTSHHSPASSDAAPASAAPCPVGAVLRMVALAMVVTAGVLAGVLFLMNRPDWWRGFAAASVASLLASAASAPAIAWGIRRARSKPELAAAGYFVAAALRATVSLGGAAAAVWLGGYPKTPTFLLALPFYFSLLGAETLLMTRALRTQPAGGAGAMEEDHA